MANGTVKVHRIVREPGSRTLISVYSTDWEVNPLQACLAVNQKGLRTIESMLVGSESLKIVEYQDDPKEFVRAALEPAEVTEITIHGTLAKVSVPDRQRSIAVGLHGREVRLAGKLTGYHINVL